MGGFIVRSSSGKIAAHVLVTGKHACMNKKGERLENPTEPTATTTILIKP